MSIAHARFDPLGFATLDWPWLVSLPEEIRLRLLAALIQTVGGQDGPVSLGQLEALTIGRHWQPPDGQCLHGATLAAGRGAAIVLAREFGRLDMPELLVLPGTSVVWDRRFRIELMTARPSPLQLGALGPAGLTQIEAAGWRRPEILARALWTQPSLLQDGVVLSAPSLGFTRHGAAIACQCEALPPRFAVLDEDCREP